MSRQFLRVDQLQQHAAAHYTEEVLHVGQGQLVVQDEPLSQVVVVVHKAGQESSAHFRQTETSFEECKRNYQSYSYAQTGKQQSLTKFSSFQSQGDIFFVILTRFKPTTFCLPVKKCEVYFNTHTTI